MRVLLYYIPEVVFYLFKVDYMFTKRTGSVHAPNIRRQTLTLVLGLRLTSKYVGMIFFIPGFGEDFLKVRKKSLPMRMK